MEKLLKLLEESKQREVLAVQKSDRLAAGSMSGTAQIAKEELPETSHTDKVVPAPPVIEVVRRVKDPEALLQSSVAESKQALSEEKPAKPINASEQKPSAVEKVEEEKL